ncbi:MAG: DUF3038 domain-containing protein [Snowella sp.]|nr:DUF3038 domain-containing protein [Snowella sp.]
MLPTVQLSNPLPTSHDLPLGKPPSPSQLGHLQCQLDILLLALASLTPLKIGDLQQAAKELKLTSFPINGAESEPLSHPRQWRSQTGDFTVERARSLVMLIGHLAQAYQELLRRAVTLMEQMQEQGKDATRTTLLGEYLANFQDVYTAYRIAEGQSLWDDLTPFAFKLLIDLLFYSAPNGHRRLWLVLLDEAQGLVYETV